MLLLRPGEGGLFAVSTNCSDVAQVPTQWLVVIAPLLDELEELVLEELELVVELLEEPLELDELELLVELVELDELPELPPTSPPQATKFRAEMKTRPNLQVVCMCLPNCCFMFEMELQLAVPAGQKCLLSARVPYQGKSLNQRTKQFLK